MQLDLGQKDQVRAAAKSARTAEHQIGMSVAVLLNSVMSVAVLLNYVAASDGHTLGRQTQGFTNEPRGFGSITPPTKALRETRHARM
jgi:hypothetical protein